MSDDEPLELTADERKALIALLRQTLDYARFPLAPRLDPLKSVLAKPEPPVRSRNQLTPPSARPHDRMILGTLHA